MLSDDERRLERLLLVYFDADPRVYEIWMLAREMTTRAIREAYFEHGVKTFSLDTVEELEKIVTRGARVLTDARTGLPTAILDAGPITAERTAAIGKADLVITGEGFLDEQTFEGKVVGGVYFGLGQEACSCASAFALRAPVARDQSTMVWTLCRPHRHCASAIERTAAGYRVRLFDRRSSPYKRDDQQMMHGGD